MSFSPDLAAYCRRIGYTGGLAPSLPTLCALQLHHVQAVPFENIDVLLGRKISLELESLERKIVHERRGGYCFEQNSLFAAVLRACGFQVTPLIARVRWQLPADVKTGRTHMVLRIDLAGEPWLVDVGFGAIGATAPLRILATAEQTTPHEPHRIVPLAHGELMHQVLVGGTWSDVYQFALEPAPPPVDFEMGNWYSCTHPNANFVRNLVVARTRPDHRLVINNREFIVRHRDGHADKSPISTWPELCSLLAQHFDLHVDPARPFHPPHLPWS